MTRWGSRVWRHRWDSTRASIPSSRRYVNQCIRESWADRWGTHLRDDQYWPTGQVVPGHSSWRSDRLQAGGGALLEHSIHAVDILCWIFGPVVRVQAHTRSVFGFELEDVATLMLEHESGVIGTLLTVFNGVRGREERRIEVFLESGAVEVTTDFIVGAAEDSFLVQRPDRDAVRPDLRRNERSAFRA